MNFYIDFLQYFEKENIGWVIIVFWFGERGGGVFVYFVYGKNYFIFSVDVKGIV